MNTNLNLYLVDLIQLLSKKNDNELEPADETKLSDLYLSINTEFIYSNNRDKLSFISNFTKNVLTFFTIEDKTSANKCFLFLENELKNFPFISYYFNIKSYCFFIQYFTFFNNRIEIDKRASLEKLVSYLNDIVNESIKYAFANEVLRLIIVHNLIVNFPKDSIAILKNILNNKNEEMDSFSLPNS